MGKPKVGIEEFCRQFYDSMVFNPMIGGLNMTEQHYETTFNIIVGTDQSFATVDRALFHREMTALRLELFCLVWGEKFKKEKFTIPQSIFTRRYLEENGKLEIWDIMGDYNHIIAQSACLTETGEQMQGRTGRARITYINSMRHQLFKEWHQANVADQSAPTEEDKTVARCVARVLNRFGADIKRDDCIVVKLLAAKLAERLGCVRNLNADAMFALAATTYGFYEGAKEALRDVKL